MVCTYVDNLFSVGRTLASAILILEDFESILQSVWGLKIKDSSRMCMTPFGSDELTRNPAKWPQVSEFPVLGHVLQDNGSTRSCWQKTSKQMWRAFFGNCAGPLAKGLSSSVKLRLLDRAVTPVLHHRNTRWPCSKKRCNELDRLQRRMVSSIARVQPLPGDNAAAYMRRRNRIISGLIGQDRWSYQHCQRVLAWDEHLRRPHNSESWAAKLLDVRGEAWLQERRQLCQRDQQSRLDSRAYFGFVAPRWHEGVAYARRVVS